RPPEGGFHGERCGWGKHPAFPILNGLPTIRMTGEITMSTGSALTENATTRSTLHPLEPLDGEEVAAAVTLLRESGKLTNRSRIVLVVLHEPPKDVVLSWHSGASVPREAFVQVLDNADGAVYEAVVSLTEGALKTWRQIPGVQPAV